MLLKKLEQIRDTQKHNYFMTKEPNKTSVRRDIKIFFRDIVLNDILTITDRQSATIDRAGGKGANLARLINAGFPVPEFFIISTSVYKRFIQHLRHTEKIHLRNFITSCDTIISHPLDPGIELKIKTAYQDLSHNGTARVSVRSSATAEDQQLFSFAGQFESYLNIQDESQLLTTIKKCWASLWSERALNYLRNHGIPPDRVKMAVVVQRMLDVRASGVLFTANPLNDNPLEMVVEVNSGSGESVVSGRSQPESYVLCKTDFLIYRQKMNSTKNSQILSATDLKHLGKICLQIERHFNKPQDIEWALEDHQVYILQSRPITTLKRKKIWTDYFFAERFPQPISPLGWSVLREPIEQNAFREPLHFLGFHALAQKKITRCFYSRPYTDLAVFKAMHTCFPTAFVSADKRTLFYDKEITLTAGIKDLLKRIAPILSTLLRTTDWIIPLHLRNWYRFIRQYQKRIHQLNQIDLKLCSTVNIYNIQRQAKKFSCELLQFHRWSITLAELLYHFISILFNHIFQNGETAQIIDQLHGGLSGNITIEMNTDLWKLAHDYKDDKTAWDKFVQKYGHRSNSLDIHLPTWAEDITYLRQVIQLFADKPDPAITERKRELLRYEQMQRISHLKLPYSIGLNVLLNWSQQLLLLRENQRFHWHRSLAIMRNVFLEIGNRLKDNGVLTDHEDIFFLTETEIHQVITNHLDRTKVVTIVQRRKRKYRQDQALRAPRIVVEGSDTSTLPLSESVPVLQGIGVSMGTVKAPARVLIDLSYFSEIESGEILVTLTTDPGWTPLFTRIAGLVTEVGGALSHGAIIAREYGIPAITNVARATQFIKTGDVLVLNGNHGIVEVRCTGFAKN